MLNELQSIKTYLTTIFRTKQTIGVKNEAYTSEKCPPAGHNYSTLYVTLRGAPNALRTTHYKVLHCNAFLIKIKTRKDLRTLQVTTYLLLHRAAVRFGTFQP